jgi:gluconate kinase
MSAAITMPAAIQGAIQSMCEDAIGQAITALSTKYGFDAEEAQRELNLGKIKISATTTKASQKKTPSDKPKRGPTGYLVFSKEMRADVRAELESELAEDEKLKPQQVVTALAARWKLLSDEEKEEWNSKAKAASTSDDEVPADEKELEKPVEKKATAKEPVEKKATAKEPVEKKAAGKKPVEKKTEKGETSKKRQSGYLLFGKEMRKDIKEALEAELEEGEKLKPQAVVTEIAAQWKALSDEEKEEWNAKAVTPQSSDADTD